MIDIRYSILTFHKLLCLLWNDLQNYTNAYPEFTPREDWLQSNWEMLVEYVLQTVEEQIFIEPYGDGADCNGVSSRVTHPEKISTHAVYFRSKLAKPANCLSGKLLGAESLGFKFERFVSVENGWFQEEPPFDHVLSQVNGDYVVLKLEEVEFFLKKII